MGLREERQGDLAILSPDVDMDAPLLPTLEGRLEALMAAGVRRVVWDLSAVGLIPSTAAGFLLQATTRLRAAGGRMALCGVTARTRATLSTMGILEVFRIYPDRAAATAAL